MNPLPPAVRRRVKFKQTLPRSTRRNGHRVQRTLVAGVLAVGLGVPAVALLRQAVREHAADQGAAPRAVTGLAVERPALLTLPAPAAVSLAAVPREDAPFPAGVGRGQFDGESAGPVTRPWEDVFAVLGTPPAPASRAADPVVAVVRPTADRVNFAAHFAPAPLPAAAAPPISFAPPGFAVADRSDLPRPAAPVAVAVVAAPTTESAPAAASVAAVTSSAAGHPVTLGPRARAAGQNLVVDQANGNSPFAVTASDTFDHVTVGNTGVGVLTQSAGTLTVPGTVTLGSGVGSDGTYNLTGGTLAVNNVTRGDGTGVFNFNGGTLQARQDNATFFQGLTTANVRGNDSTPGSGAVVDTAGFNVTIAQNLQHTTIGGDAATDGGLTKLGAGTLTLTGTNNYTGATRINGGTLAFANAASIGGAGNPSGVEFNNTAELLATADVTLARNLTANPEATAIFSAAPGKTLTLSPGFISQLANADLVFGSPGSPGVVVLNDPVGFGTQGGTLTLTVAAGTLRAGGNFGVPFLTSRNFPTTVAAGATLDYNGFDARNLVLDNPILRNVQGAGTVLTGGDATTNITVGQGNFAGALSGPGGFTKTTADTLTLSGTGGSVGRLTVSAGSVTVNGGTTTAGILNVDGTGTLNVSAGGNVTATGLTTLGSAVARVNVNGGTLFTGGLTNPSNAGAVVSLTNPAGGGVALTVGGDHSDSTFSGVLQNAAGGAGGLTKVGMGTFTLSGGKANTFTGLTSVTGGVLELNRDANVNAIGGALAVGNPGADPAAGTVPAATARLLAGGQFPASSAVTVFGDGLLAINGGMITATNAAVGSLTMTGGEVRFGFGGRLILNGDVTINGSTAGSRFTSTATFPLDLNGTRTFTVADGAARYDLDLAAATFLGTLNKAGAGVLRLNAPDNVSTLIAFNLTAGTLALGQNFALGVIGNTFTLAGGTVVADGGDRTLSNNVALTGDATLGASLEGVPRALTFTGTTTLTGNRTLTVNNDAPTNLGAVALGTNNRLTVNGTGNTTITGAISDLGAGGGLTKTGPGTLTLLGDSTFGGGPGSGTVVAGGLLLVDNPTGSGTGNGAVSVQNGGTLGGNGTIGNNLFVENGGTLSPGDSPGELTVLGGVNLAAGAILFLELGGLTPGVGGYDQVNVGNTLSLLGANLSVQVVGGFTLTPSQTFFVLDRTGTDVSAVGTFANAPGDIYTDAAGNVFLVNYADANPADADRLPNDVSLTVITVAVPEPGTWALLLAGAGSLGAGAALRRRRAAA